VNSTASQKVALVTGANKGIGREIAQRLGALGYRVYMGARDQTRGAAAAHAYADSGWDMRYIEMDVTRVETLSAAAARVREETGYLDVLVNNAGIVTDLLTPSVTHIDNVRRTFDTNVIGVIATTQALLPLLRAGTSKIIINLSSALGSLTRHSDPVHGAAVFNAFAYNASKTTLNAFTVMLAKELAPEGFRINAICPGATATDMNGRRASGAVEDAGQTVIEKICAGPSGGTGGFSNAEGVLPW